MPLTVSTEFIDYHFAYSPKTKRMIIQFEESLQNGHGRVTQRPATAHGWRWDETRQGLRPVRLPKDIEDYVYLEFIKKIQPYMPEIRYHLKTVIQKELFNVDL